MNIRPETEKDFSQIYELVKVAFQTAKDSDGKEQDFVNKLRAGGGYIPELALVAEAEGKLIGHIMLTRTYIDGAKGRLEALLLAPISVVLERRDQGIGASLIRESFRLAKQRGYKAVFLVGDPGYYQRFGFKATVDFGIKNTHNIPEQYVMACELVPGVLKGVSGSWDWESGM